MSKFFLSILVSLFCSTLTFAVSLDDLKSNLSDSQIESLKNQYTPQQRTDRPTAPQTQYVLPSANRTATNDKKTDLPEKKDTSADAALTPFGYAYFKSVSGALVPDASISPPADYILGPGDSLNIRLWGKISQDLSITIDKNGKIFIPNLGTIYVWGVPFDKAKELIHKQFSKNYTNFSLSITLGELRTIQVFILGEITHPGAYQVSSLTTVFNALYLAGGPKTSGSLRQIKLIRNNKVQKKLDIYRFLLEGDKSQDLRLNSGDTIFIPPIGPQVGIKGEIVRPHFYELKHSEKISDLIELAEGIKPTSYLERIQLIRIQDHDQKQVLDIPIKNYKRFSRSKNNAVLENGDMLEIFAIPTELRHYFTVTGAVQRPGKYESKNKTVKQAIHQAEGLTPDAYPEQAHIKRPISSSENILIAVNLNQARQKDPSHNIVLKEFDELIVYTKQQLFPQAWITVKGAVNQPGPIPYQEGMQLFDAIILSKGLLSEAHLDKIQIFRKKDDSQFERVFVDISDFYLSKQDSPHNIVILPMDEITIFSRSHFIVDPSVSIEGSVLNPGEYPYSEGLTVSQLVSIAGILNEYTIDQADILKFDPVTGKKKVITISSADIQSEAPSSVLHPFDRVVLKTSSEWGAKKMITLRGQFIYPGSYYVQDSDTLKDIIERAGGLRKEAFVAGAIYEKQAITKSQITAKRNYQSLLEKEAIITAFENQNSQNTAEANDQIKLLDQFSDTSGRLIINLQEALSGVLNLEISDGDILEVPSIPNYITMTGEIYYQGGIIYEPHRNAHYYIQKSGGFTPKSDASGTFVLQADGFISKNLNRTVQKGDKIIVPISLEEKTNLLVILSEIITKTAQVLVSYKVITDIVTP